MITEYLKPSEAAELLRSSRSTLAKLRLTGSGPAFVRIGGGRYVTGEATLILDEQVEIIDQPEGAVMNIRSDRRTCKTFSFQPLSAPTARVLERAGIEISGLGSTFAAA